MRRASNVVTVTLSTGVAQVCKGTAEALKMFEEVLHTEHTTAETVMSIGDEEYLTSDKGPWPNHQLRISASPSAGCAAINYMDHDDPQMTIANSFNPSSDFSGVHLVFNGRVGSMFPQDAAIPISLARDALHEWLDTHKRPTCIEWRPYDHY